MSDAAEKLAQTRLAIIAHVQARERRHERDRDDDSFADEARAAAHEASSRAQRLWQRVDPRGGRAAGWLAHAKHLVRTWWRHHPASMGVDLARPVLSSYAARKPAQYLGIAAAAGAVFMLVRPWRVVSATGLVVALLKSSQLSGLVMSALAGAGAGHEDEPPV